MRTLIKKIVFKVLGSKVYEKAYAKGKIYDINKGNLIEPEIDFLPHFISEDSFVLDIGANYGHYTIIMSRIAQKGQVFAFEPIPFTFNVLERIKSHFKQNNIQTYHAAVSDKKEKLTMNVPLLDFGAPNTGVAFVGEQKDSKSKTFQVDSLKLDEMSFENKIDFIKIDIEGHEPSAFEGMKALLAKDKPVILIEFSFPCLMRAGIEPDDFSNKISEQLNYSFFQVNGEKLKVTDGKPSDGYYFLIPNSKVNDFKHIIE